MRSTILAATIVVVAQYLPVLGECGSDVECKGDRICQDGRCVDPSPRPGAQPTQTPVWSGARVRHSEMSVSRGRRSAEAGGTASQEELGAWAVWVNPLGFVEFGPTIGLELRVVQNLYVGAHYRYAAMGAMYDALETRSGSDEVWMGSAAVGLESKYYAPVGDSPHFFYYGFFGEYAWGGHASKERDPDVTDPLGYDVYVDSYEARSTSIVFGSSLGFRWRFGPTRKVLLSLGLLTGVGRETSDYHEYVDDTVGRIDRPLDNVFFGMLELGIGYGM